jgi:GGDEF domain-containing protein
MIRIVLVLLAVLVAVLAFIFDRPWLYVAAAVPLVGALGLLGRHLWEAYQRQRASTRSASAPPDDDSLEELGIMDVRPQEREGGNNGASGDASGDPGPSVAPSADSAGTAAEAVSASSTSGLPEAGTEAGATQTRESMTEATPASSDRPVLDPYLESLRAAIGADTVALLRQEDVMLEYTIEALASRHADVQRSGSFETQAPLLSATMSRRPVTVQRLDDEEQPDLPYDDSPPSLTQRALAPVAEPDSPATVFLLADATAEADLGASEVRALLERFADTIRLLREAEESPGPEASPEPSVDDGRDPEPSSPEPASSDAPRPRREIIAEEMAAADAGEEDLALVLVHLNRAESIARRGREAVDTAEQLLQTRLEHFAPGERVERFGELTYGLFPRRDVEAVEEWAADLQATLAQETGELEGGVSVGVAVRGTHHDPEELRADATEALREAYETGTCTIVA